MRENSWDGVLRQGEKLLWQGQPRPRPRYRPRNVPETLMGLFFMGFSLGWMNLVMSMNGGPMWMFGLIFFAIGFYNAIGKWIWLPLLRRGTWYSLSDSRAFIARERPFLGRALEDWPIGPETRVEYDPTLNAVWFARHAAGNGPGKRVGFIGLDDADEVYRLMQEIRSEAQ